MVSYTGITQLRGANTLRGKRDDNVWSMVWFSDTQFVSQNNLPYLQAMVDDVLSKQDSLNILAALHTGDVWQNEEIDAEVSGAGTILRQLADNMLFGANPGNHCYYDDGRQGRGDSKFKEQFPLSMYSTKPWFVGCYSDTETTNVSSKLTIAGKKYLFINMEVHPRDEILTWADGIIEQENPDRIILATHSYLYGLGYLQPNTDFRSSPARAGYCNYSTTGNCNSGTQMWDKFVSQHNNIILVISGHTVDGYPNTTWMDWPSTVEDRNGIAVSRLVTTLNGNPINQLLANYQDLDRYDEVTPSEDAAVLTYITFNETTKTATVKTYNPVTDTYWTGDTDQFTFNFS